MRARWLKTLILALGLIKSSAIVDADTGWGQAIRRSDLAPKRTQIETNPDEESVEVAIIGGGLVGLACTIGLTRAGIPCKLYERASELRTNSQGMLSIENHGQASLERICPGIMDRIRAVGCERKFSSHVKIDENGEVTQTTRQVPDGQHPVQLSWHQLHLALASQIDNTSHTIATGRSLVSFQESDNDVLLEFEEGPRVRARAVIAADGVFSVTRRQLMPNTIPIYFGQLNWNTVINTQSIPKHEMIHPSGGICFLSSQQDPMWTAFVNDAGSGTTFWQALETWRSPGGRVALIGDSAHAMHPCLGQGANSGFLEASVLMDSMIDSYTRFSKAGSRRRGKEKQVEWRKALRQYEQKIKPRIDVLQAASNYFGVVQAAWKQGANEESMNPETAAQLTEWMRNLDFSKAPPKSAVAWLASFEPLSKQGVSPLWE